jgi:hypothetical protein
MNRSGARDGARPEGRPSGQLGAGDAEHRPVVFRWRRPRLDPRLRDPPLHRLSLGGGREAVEREVEIGRGPAVDGVPAGWPGDAFGGCLQLGRVGQAEGLRAVEAGDVRQLAEADLVAVPAALWSCHRQPPVGHGPTPRRPVLSRATRTAKPAR